MTGTAVAPASFAQPAAPHPPQPVTRDTLRLATFGRVALTISCSRLSRNGRQILLALASLLDWSSWRGQFPTWWIAARAGVSPDTVVRGLPELINARLISREEPPRSSPIWQLHLDAVLTLELTPLRKPSSAPLAAPMPPQGAVPQQEARHFPGQAAPSPRQAAAPSLEDLRTYDSSDQALSQHQSILSASIEEPHRLANPPTALAQVEPVPIAMGTGLKTQSPEEKRFLEILQRWSGPEAPESHRWKVQPASDLRWFCQEVAPRRLPDGLTLLDVLSGWDEFLELIARGHRQYSFPSNFKHSLRNQLAMWERRLTFSSPGGQTAPGPGQSVTMQDPVPGSQQPPSAQRGMSYAEHCLRQQRARKAPWPREEFDRIVRENGLIPEE